MCRVIATFIDMPLDDGWCHPVIGEDEIDSALLGFFFGVASNSSRFALASDFIVADVCPPMFFDEGQCRGDFCLSYR